MEPMFTISPLLRAAICGNTACDIRMIEKVLASKIFLIASMGVSTKAPTMMLVVAHAAHDVDEHTRSTRSCIVDENINLTFVVYDGRHDTLHFLIVHDVQFQHMDGWVCELHALGVPCRCVHHAPLLRVLIASLGLRKL